MPSKKKKGKKPGAAAASAVAASSSAGVEERQQRQNPPAAVSGPSSRETTPPQPAPVSVAAPQQQPVVKEQQPAVGKRQGSPRKQQQQQLSIPLTFGKMSIESKSEGSFARPFASKEERARHVGKEGRPIQLTTNHFPLQMKLKDVTHYDVQPFIPELKRAPKKAESDLTTRAFVKMVADNPDVFPDRHGVVYDGVSNAFSAQPLRFANNAKDFKASTSVREMNDLDPRAEQRELKVNFKLTRVATVAIRDAIAEFQRKGGVLVGGGGGGGNEYRHSNAVQAMNIILGMVTRIKFDPVDRCHFPPKPSVIDLGQGKSLWVGTFKSVRVGWKVTLNVDMANKPGYEKGSLLEFIGKLLADPRGDGRPLSLPDVQRQLGQERIRKKVSDELKGLKIRFYRPKGGPREYRANALTDAPSKRLLLQSEDESGRKTTKSVYDYWLNEFGYKIANPDLPCLHVGSVNRTIYWPLERCEIKKQVCPSKKKLTEDQTGKMIRQTAVPPSLRKKRIVDNLREIENSYKNDPYARSFGISLDDRMANVEGRVLTAPSLSYKASKPGGAGDVLNQVTVADGKWRMPDRTQFVNPMVLEVWGVLNLSGLSNAVVDGFVDGLYDEGRKCGFKIDPPFKPIPTAGENDLRDIERAFEKLHDDVRRKHGGKKPQIILVITSRKGPVRDRVKLLGDVHQRMPTQFVMRKNVDRCNGQIYHNICLKLNSKLGGTNQILHASSRPAILSKPVMFMGADVTHPAPGESAAARPSIAAVVASCDPKASVYNTEVSLQIGDQAIEEITKLEEMTRSLLLKFLDRTGGRKPERIVFYRDGVSEGQFDVVLCKELTAIQRACASLEPDYKPGITFVVAQKRHNTRLFPCNEREGVGRNKNVPPGTVVDVDITHPTETSFFLASHEGIQGTTRPTHYHLLSDDNDLGSDELQKITYYLCHLYSRCERSVSYPSPTYYAHLAAFRARGHHNALVDGGNGDSPAEWKKIEKMAIVNHFV